MFKRKIYSLLLIITILSPLSVVTFAENAAEYTIESSTEKSTETLPQEIATENSTEVPVDNSETENTQELENERDTEKQVEEEVNSMSDVLEDVMEDGEYSYPFDRSDLAPFSDSEINGRATNNFVSITEKNIPRSNFIDISSHNGALTVNEFKIIKSYGVTGVVVKLTEGTSYRNPYAKQQILNAREAGLLVSAYHYSWFKSDSEARAEANYFAAMARELNLPSTTLMVNDIEDGQLKPLNNNTANSLAFEQQLNANGFNNVNHYLGLHWINEKRIDPVALGHSKIWIAAYPLVPTAQQQHTQYGAWQWSSKMSFPGVSGTFDISSDYVGNYSIPPQGNYISDGRYVQVTKTGYSTWSNFDWKYRDTTDNLYGQTFLARGRYQHINGYTYFSLYDNQGKWHGYLNAGATTVLAGPQGNYISDGNYVSIQSKNETIWRNFNFNSPIMATASVYQKTYLAKGRYEHFNGKTYYSLYGASGNWVGYLDSDATIVAPNSGGVYIPDGRYVTVKSKNYNTWRNFSWKFFESTDKIYQQTYLARGRYENANGSTYLSLYDNAGVWHGYINENGVGIAGGPQGIYLSEGSYASINDANTNLYNNFNGSIRKSTKPLYQNNYHAKGRYNHINGKVYYSLYDQSNVWQGYAESDTVIITNNAQGPYISYGKKVKISSKNYSIWGNFSWRRVDYSSTYYGKTLTARGLYKHINGSVYYSLYDNNGNWIGYINSNATK